MNLSKIIILLLITFNLESVDNNFCKHIECNDYGIEITMSLEDIFNKFKKLFENYKVNIVLIESALKKISFKERIKNQLKYNSLTIAKQVYEELCIDIYRRINMLNDEQYKAHMNQDLINKLEEFLRNHN